MLPAAARPSFHYQLLLWWEHSRICCFHCGRPRGVFGVTVSGTAMGVLAHALHTRVRASLVGICKLCFASAGPAKQFSAPKPFTYISSLSSHVNLLT